jgi:hypothetical protein
VSTTVATTSTTAATTTPTTAAATITIPAAAVAAVSTALERRLGLFLLVLLFPVGFGDCSALE